MSAYIKGDGFTKDSWLEYLDHLNTFSYHAGIEVFGDTPGILGVDIDADVYEGYPPIISFNTELDSDGEENYITFLPTVELPTIELTAGDYADRISYILQLYAEKLGPWTKEMATTPYSVDRYTVYEDDIESTTDIEASDSGFDLQRIPWDNYLPEDVLDRLKDCRNTKEDLNVLRDALYQYIVDSGEAASGWGMEDAAELALEWVGDWNNQFTLTDLTTEEWNEFIDGGNIR